MSNGNYMGGGTGGAGGGTFGNSKGNFFNTGLGSGLVGGLASGLGSLFTIGAQKRAATTAFKRQKELFDYQAAYNTPAKQMQRLKEAGLNPALMYGKGTVGNVDSFAGVQKANVTGPELAQAVASGSQMSLLNTQRKLQESQKDLQDSQASLNAIEGGVKTGHLGVAKALAKSSIELNAQKIEESKSQIGYLGAQSNYISKQTSLAVQTINHQNQTGMLKGDIMGNLAKALNINVSTSEGRKDAYLKVGALILGKKILDLAPQVIEMISKRLGGKFTGDDIADGLKRNVYSNSDKNKIIDTIIDLWK